MYDKITGKERSEKLKQLEASLISQQQYFARARESNENATKASYEVAALIAKHSKPFTEGEFIKDCVMTIVKKICPEKQQEFAKVCLALDITKHLNALNTSLQGPDAVISQLYSHIKAFGTKLKLFERHLSQSQPNTAHFSALQEIMTRFPQSNVSAQMRRYASDISSLAEEFRQRFQDFAAIEKEIAIFSSPFSVDTDDVPDHLQLELIELQCDAESRSRHQQLSLANFYRQLDKDRFREIRAFAKKMLSLFGSTYLCEKTFSVMNLNKSRVRTRLTDSHLRDTLRINTTAFEPDLAFVLQSRSQYHPSH
ncbi:General transcription factor II-I repeat domain-containing protein 2B [Larimichthys crocea]|uniref:General transcription factor II-I repeat domain-containing protein 2B n=1 Tax=Larimichthys crocea TaxID=215358 RepID=A0A6G0I923_LARCR|nr:General transcription factor II-I repeat domain-containing protein 2B [Larimichthys crocea]